jgi:hypothetical protein
MKAPPDLPEVAARYFEQAATLRLCLQYNREDYEFAQAGGRIVYIADANVVRFFIDPETEARHVAVFGRSKSAHYSAGTALIAAEFLFSRQLAGQDDSPSLIMPGHANELLGLVDKIRRDFNQDAGKGSQSNEEQLQPGTLEQLRALIDRVRTDQQVVRANAIDQLRHLVPEVAEEILKGSFLKVKQLHRLYEDDLLRPLALHTAATRDVLQPDDRLVSFWEDRIRLERRSHEAHLKSLGFRPDEAVDGEGERQFAPDTERVEHDAEALVQTMLLDAAVVDAKRTAYVMVTADRRLFDAYAKWYWEEVDADRRGRFLLRTPLQYAPILNVLEMPNGIYSSEVFVKASTALDTLFSNLSRTDYPHKLALYRIRARGEQNKLREMLSEALDTDQPSLNHQGLQEFRRIRTEWHGSFQTGILLNAGLMQRRLRSEFGPLARLLHENANLRQELHEDQQRSLERIEGAHLHFNTRLNLSLMARRPGRAGAAAQRGLFLVRAKFPDLVGEGSVKAALDRLAGVDHKLIANIDRNLESAIDYRDFFFAACVAFRCENWRAAAHYANRSLRLMSSDDTDPAEKDEISFLVALATRYAWASGQLSRYASRDAIARAFDLLDESAKFCGARQDAFGLGRALVDHNSLTLMVLYHGCLLAQPGTVGPRAPIESFREIADEARRTVPRTNEMVTGSGDLIDPNALETLTIQMVANVISAGVFAQCLSDDEAIAEQLSPSKEELEAALDELKPRLGTGRLPPILVVEHLMAQWIVGRVNRPAAARELDRLIPPESATDLTLDLDRVELDRFRSLLATGPRRHAPSHHAHA